MLDVQLIHTTGDPEIDRILRGVVTTLEAAFPDRVRGYYLIGSFADSTAVGTSDVDMLILFKGDFTDPDEAGRARQLVDRCNESSPVDLDLVAHPVER